MRILIHKDEETGKFYFTIGNFSGGEVVTSKFLFKSARYAANSAISFLNKTRALRLDRVRIKVNGRWKKLNF